MLWFKHDSGACRDAKIQKLILKYGADGYAIYFHCLELIVSGVSEKKITFELEHDAEIIASNLRISGTATESAIQRTEIIMRYIVSLGLFEESDGHIFCKKLAVRLDKSMSSNPQYRSLIDAIKTKSDHDVVMTIPDDIMTNSDVVRNRHARLDKTRLDKTRLNESIPASADALHRAPKKKYGVFANVLLTDAEYTKAIALPLGAERIELLSEYIERKGYKAKSHYLCICGWVADAVVERNKKHPAVTATPPTETWQSRAEAMERRKAELKARAAVVNAQYKAGKLTLEEFWKIVEEESLHEWAE